MWDCCSYSIAKTLDPRRVAAVSIVRHKGKPLSLLCVRLSVTALEGASPSGKLMYDAPETVSVPA